MKINSVAFGTAEPLTLIRPYPPPKGSGLSGSIGKFEHRVSKLGGWDTNVIEKKNVVKKVGN